ncbi:hypothetical protein C8J57DRAFT_1529150 [Mycena rebaudengoi]|nr:hypothetical protein C8J57DRAFT_1529150 [Mycena rebaudengoi]
MTRTSPSLIQVRRWPYLTQTRQGPRMHLPPPYLRYLRYLLTPPTPTSPIPPVPHERSNTKLNAYTNFEAPARKPRHINNAVPIKVKFTLMKERVATVPGWIGLRDNGVCPAEQAAGAEEKGWNLVTPSPTFSATTRFLMVSPLSPT